MPQSVAADIMDLVAAGQVDAKQAAGFLRDGMPMRHSTWFHFTLRPNYFANVDEVREPHLHGGHGSTKADRVAADQAVRGLNHNGAMGSDNRMAGNPLGKLPGSVWTIATQPLRVPAELGVDHFAAFPMEWPRRIISGWCPPDGTVLDPFGGTGTTALVADVLGRKGISVDLSADYCRLAEWRTSDPRERARVQRSVR